MRSILVLLFILGCHFVFGQSLEGTRVFTGTLSPFIETVDGTFRNTEGKMQPSHRYIYGLYPQISYGKIGKRNVLVTYGLSLGYELSKQKDSAVIVRDPSYTLAPVFIAQKYIALINRLYYAPAVDIQVGYHKLKGTEDYGLTKIEEKKYYAEANLKLISLSYVVKRNLFFMFQCGVLSLEYARDKTYRGATTLYKMSDYNGLSFGFNSAVFAFGFQKLLSSKKESK